jgi:pyochelin biosynthetic protein PchC
MTINAPRGGWLRIPAPRPVPALRLVCFPHAGGTAGFFRRWARWLPASVELVCVQYPGREDRIAEPCMHRMDQLVTEVTAALAPLSDVPFALFGHSLGAAVGYEVAQRLEPHGPAGSPRLLVVSGRPAPHRQRVETVHLGGDEALLADLRRLGATSEELLGDPEIRDLVLPSLRADYEVSESYRPTAPLPTLTTRVAAYLADGDPEVTEAEAAAWAEVTSGPFTLERFPGDHFYLRSDEAAVVARTLRLLHQPATASAGWPSTP